MKNRILVERQRGIVTLTMDGANNVNTIDGAFCEQMLAALRDTGSIASDRVVILRSAGRIFSAGGDLAEIARGLDASCSALDTLISAFHEVVLALHRLPIPVLTSVHGAAAGAGFSLALACDLVVASSDARFVVGYPAIGTSCDGGLSFQLARRLGAARALDLFLLRDSIGAAQGESLGLIQQVVEPESLHGASVAVAEKIASLSAHAVGEIKQLLNSALGDGLEEHLRREKDAFLRCASTQAFRRQIDAFLNRSKEATGRSAAPVSSGSPRMETRS